ncbi:unnamed protein product (macronuclear) [Paramecium tetraurelia]|uniref:Cyclic nucleotide-binding domain-containing protein n=1 Tax=Paramecium tetraurelia TaxID=5888 RepID=A0BU19_PARTE|nr:uncharacterized protein GSPATT00032268001 [Paramecium tetraurelia]CAK62036.1 unnamed protein product [Paramecium tetraurelia]|eukprot:XP_001429434.1 hypothetical protein (macronuclear) [Paramecium tetraurelia strain d4-2]
MNFNDFQTERIITCRGELTKPDTHNFADNDSPENSLVEGFDLVWKRHSLQIFCAAIKFIVKLRKAVDQYHLRQITHRIYQIIGDKASDYLFYQSKGLVNQKWSFNQYIKSLLIYNFLVDMNIRVIKPDSKVKLLVDCTILILIVMNIFYIPMQLSFSLQENAQTVDFLFSTIPSWVFLMEIVVNFNTAYYYKGMIHEDRSKIFQHYIKGDFFKDVLVVIPFLISQYNIPYLNFVLLLRMTRVNKIFEQIEEITLIREKFAAPIDVMKLMLFLVFVAHMSGCAWHYIGIQELFYNNTGWLIKYGYGEKDWITRYVASLYFGTITSFTVGFGDIVPQTLIEQIYLIIMVLITSLVFGYTISSIQNIFGQLREKTDQHRNKMAKINSYMKKNKISPMLQMKIRKYFEYFFTLDESPELLMDNLNDDLKLELRTSIFIPIMIKCKLFQKFDESLLNQLCTIVQTQKFIPGQIIFQENDQMNKAYFIIQGEVDIQINKVSIKQQSEGSLGIREFFLQKRIHYVTRATQFTEIAYIRYDDFYRIIREKQSNQEQYCQMKDDLLYSTVQTSCEICSHSHNFNRCPVVFYSPSTYKIACDQSDSIVQPRYQNKRKQKKKRKTFEDLQLNITSAIDYMCDNETLSEGMNESILKRYGYVDFQTKQQTLEDDKLKSLKVIQKLQLNSNNNGDTPRMKRFVYKSLIKKEDKSQQKYQESQLENLHQEFIQFKKEDLNQFDQHVEFSHFHKDKNISKVLNNFQKQQHSKPREQFYSKTRLGKTKMTHAINIIQNTQPNLINNSNFKTIFNNK